MAIKKTNVMVFCPMCNCESESVNFYESQNPHDGCEFNKDGSVKKIGYVRYCKNHIAKCYLDYLKKGNMQSAVYFTCALTDTPFIKEVYDRYIELRNEKIKSGKLTPTQLKTYNDFAKYREQLRTMKKAMDNWNDFSDTNVDYKDIMGLKKPDIALEAEKDKFILNWGMQEQMSDYELLEFFFDELTDGVKFINKGQEFLYRDLCQARLKKRKIENGESDDDISKVQTQILTLMKTLKIDNFEEKKEQTIVERMLESRINDLEMHDPAQYYDNLKINSDFCGRGKYFYDHIYRPFKNVFTGSRLYNIKPEKEDTTTDEEYEELMKQEKTKKGD